VKGRLNTSQETSAGGTSCNKTISEAPVEMLGPQNPHALFLRPSDQEERMCSRREHAEVPERLLASCHGDHDRARSPLHSRSLSSKLSCLLQRVSSDWEVEKTASKNSGGFAEVSGMDSSDRELGNERDRAEEVKEEKKRQLCNSKVSSTTLSTSSSRFSQQISISNRTEKAKECDLPVSERRVRYHPTFLSSTVRNRAACWITNGPCLDMPMELLNSAKSGQHTGGRSRLAPRQDSEAGSSLPVVLSLQTFNTSNNLTDNRLSDTISSELESDSSNALDRVSSKQPGRIEGSDDCLSSLAEVPTSLNDAQCIVAGRTREGDQAHTPGLYQDYASPLWQEVKNPSTGRMIFIHKRSGTASAEGPVKPRGVASAAAMATHGGAVNAGRVLQPPLMGATGTTPEPGSTPASSSSYGSRPLSAAPHLSFDFDRFVPSSKRLRMGGDYSLNTDVPLRTCTFASSSYDKLEEGKSGRGKRWSCKDVSGSISIDQTSPRTGELGRPEVGSLGSSVLTGLPGNRIEGSDLPSDLTSNTRYSRCTKVGLTGEANEESIALPKGAGLEKVAANSLEWNGNGIMEAGHVAEWSSEGEREGEQEIWEKGAFERLLESWTNPSFLAGQQVCGWMGGWVPYQTWELAKKIFRLERVAFFAF